MAKPLYVYTGTDWVPVASELESTSQYLPITQAQAPFRNLIINGAMQVAQRGTSVASITTDGYYTADRFIQRNTTLGTWTQSVETDAPTGSGFRKSLKMLCTTADASPAAGDLMFVGQLFEGQNLQQFLKGTASAKQFTVSFWVKSNVTGTYIAELQDLDNSRAVSASYTISVSATWEKKTITFPADATGAFDNDNAGSLSLNFWLGAGSNRTSGTLQTTWAAIVNANRVVGGTNLAAATSNYWQITGVQLEVGAVATPFEFKPFDQELKECQRYYAKSCKYETVVGDGVAYGEGVYMAGGSHNTNSLSTPSISFPVTMRATPTITFFRTNLSASNGQWAFFDGSAHRDGVGTSVLGSNENRFSVTFTYTGATAYRSNITSGQWKAETEL
ncbi:MAG: hypothetical protein WAO29_01425 [Candidatus Nanopelagicales bacterium]